MPDPLKQTVSASQAAGLFNLSPYVTRWMLFHHFANGLDLDAKPNERMDWGNRLEGEILRACADELRLDVTRNTTQAYARYNEPDNCAKLVAPLGCTVDATIRCPTRGPGIVEAKNVDWLVWKREWTATTAPRHIEIQLQVQMLVLGAKWGVIGALIGGNDLIIYERQPMPEIQQQLIEESRAFMVEVAERREPDAFGSERELPALAALYPEVEQDEVMDLTGAGDAGDEFGFLLTQYADAQLQKSAATKLEKKLKARVLAKTQTAGMVLAPAVSARINKSQVPESTRVYKASTRTTIKVTAEIEEPTQPADFGEVIENYDKLHGAT